MLFKKSWMWCIFGLLIGCAQPADIKNPQAYNEFGLSFEYPGNWKVIFNEENDGARNIDIESNQSAMTYVIELPQEAVLTPEDFEKKFMDGFKNKVAAEGGQVSVSQSVPVEAKIDGKSRSGIKNRLVVQVDENQEIFHQIYYLVSHEQGMTCLIFQVADHDMIGTIKGFELILSTIHKSIAMESI